MRRVTVVMALAAFSVLTLAGQVGPVFEVASIRRNVSGDQNWGFAAQPGGVMVATNVTARQIVRYAYSMQNSAVEGGGDWVDAEHYDITAKAAEAVPQDRMLLMLQSLLRDRFKLAMHIEPRDTPVFALVLARADRRLGPQLRANPVDCTTIRADIARGAPIPVTGDRPLCAGRSRPGVITAGAVTIEEVARNMSRLVGRVVVDGTGLQGRYDLDLKFVPDAELTAPAANGAAPEGPSLFAALEEQLGLKLEATRAPVDVAVIDAITRPVEN